MSPPTDPLAALPLTSEQKRQLAALGVRELSQLQGMLGVPSVRSRVAESLGLSDAAVSALEGALSRAGAAPEPPPRWPLPPPGLDVPPEMDPVAPATPTDEEEP